MVLRPVFGIGECLGEWIVLDFQSSDFFVLVSRDCNKLCFDEGNHLDHPVLIMLRPRIDFDNVKPGLVLVKTVQHDLVLGTAFIGQLDFGKADGFLGPVTAVIWRVWMFVDG